MLLVFKPSNFFFWGSLKSQAYETPVAKVEDLVAQIIVTSEDINRTQDLIERVRKSSVLRFRLCFDLRGHNFKQFLLKLFVILFLTSSWDASFVFQTYFTSNVFLTSYFPIPFHSTSQPS
ncbi:hypothetical protein TNCV_3104111 [Trichonephila clavipes]|nr:hypothetical protein TNCV_3104111 [Trichonephila clavipes]